MSSGAVADLSAALLDSPYPLTVEQLAAYLDATPDAVTDLLDELDRRLRPTGLGVHQSNEGVTLVSHAVAASDRLSPQQRQQLIDGTLPKDLLGLVHHAFDGPITLDPRHRRRPDRNRALHLGLLQPVQDPASPGDALELTADVRFSLLLDDECSAR